MAKPCTPHLIAQRVQLFEIETANVKRLSFGRSHRPFSFSGKKMGGVVLPSAGGIFFLAKRQELLYAYMHNVKPYG